MNSRKMHWLLMLRGKINSTQLLPHDDRIFCCFNYNVFCHWILHSVIQFNHHWNTLICVYALATSWFLLSLIKSLFSVVFLWNTLPIVTNDIKSFAQVNINSNIRYNVLIKNAFAFLFLLYSFHMKKKVFNSNL